MMFELSLESAVNFIMYVFQPIIQLRLSVAGMIFVKLLYVMTSILKVAFVMRKVAWMVRSFLIYQPTHLNG